MGFMGIRNIVAQNIKRIRKEQNMTQAQLAEYTDLSNTYIANIECGKTWISDTTLEKIAAALNTDFYLFFMPVDGNIKEEPTKMLSVRLLLKKYEDVIKKNVDDTFKLLYKDLSSMSSCHTPEPTAAL